MQQFQGGADVNLESCNLAYSEYEHYSCKAWNGAKEEGDTGGGPWVWRNTMKLKR